jgi:hypothetical protein
MDISFIPGEPDRRGIWVDLSAHRMISKRVDGRVIPGHKDFGPTLNNDWM